MKIYSLQSMRLLVAALVSMLAMNTFVSCSEDKDTILTFHGELTSSVPVVPDFEPTTCSNTAVLTWIDDDQSQATVTLGAFDIDINANGRHMAYSIGEMVITDVNCTKVGSTIKLENKGFECQAGDYLTKGSLVGSLEGNTLTFTLLYKPGKMQMNVQSVFVSK